MNTSPNTNTSASTNTANRTGRQRLMILALSLVLTLLSTACMPGTGDNSLDSEAVDLGTVAATAETGNGSGSGNGNSNGSGNSNGNGDVSASFGAADAYSASQTRAIVLVEELNLYDGPGGFAIGTMSATTEYGTNRVLLAEATDGNWVRVRLPMRPNHTSAWVAAGDVKLENIEPTVEVDLATRTLTVRSAGTVLAQATVAVGSDENPTPRGTFYITDKLETSNPGGSYGPYALGLSGFSETLSEFGGGNGQIGIHGTNDPGTLGQPVSHGCIRLPNDVVTLLAGVLPLGTPVHVV